MVRFTKSKSLFSVLAALSMMMLSIHSSADKIILKNGDTITCNVEKTMDGKLVVSTDYSGPIEIDMTKISRISTEKPMEIHFKNGEILKGTIQSGDEGEMKISSSEGRRETSIEWNQVASINAPPPVKPAPKWTGSINLGGEYQKGNTERTSGFISIDATKKTDNDRISTKYQFNYSEEEGNLTAKSHYGELKYDYFYSKRAYAYLSTELLKDEFKDLDLRTIVGPGVGYQIWDDAQKSLSAEGGLSYVNENKISEEDDSSITLRLSANYKYKFSKGIIFTDKILIYPDLDKTGEFIIRNEAGISTPISQKWALKLSNVFDYDSDADVDVKDTDIKTTLGLQYTY